MFRMGSARIGESIAKKSNCLKAHNNNSYDLFLRILPLFCQLGSSVPSPMQRRVIIASRPLVTRHPDPAHTAGDTTSAESRCAGTPRRSALPRHANSASYAARHPHSRVTQAVEQARAPELAPVAAVGRFIAGARWRLWLAVLTGVAGGCAGRRLETEALQPAGAALPDLQLAGQRQVRAVFLSSADERNSENSKTMR
jgi:hypothetical protein